MIKPTPRAADLEAGLAEIDRRLRQIQDELVGAEPDSPPEAERAEVDQDAERSASKRQGRSGPLAAVLQRASRSAPSSGNEVPEGSDAQRIDDARTQLLDLERQLKDLAELRDRLLSSIRDLLDGYQAVAKTQPGALGATASDPGADVTLSAGPFTTLEAVRAFEHAVSAIPGVHETTLRGYEGADRAIVDVRLERR